MSWPPPTDKIRGIRITVTKYGTHRVEGPAYPGHRGMTYLGYIVHEHGGYFFEDAGGCRVNHCAASPEGLVGPIRRHFNLDPR